MDISKRCGLVIQREYDNQPIAIITDSSELMKAISEEHCGAKVHTIDYVYNKHTCMWSIKAKIDNDEGGVDEHDFVGFEAVIYDRKRRDVKVYRLSHDHRHGTSVYVFESNKNLEGNYWEDTHLDELKMIAPVIKALEIDLELDRGETIDIEEVAAPDAVIII